MPHRHDAPAKAPNLHNLRLVRTLSEDDGMGGGCLGFGGRTSYVMPQNGGLIVASPEECQLKVFDARGMLVGLIACRKDDYDAPLHPDMIALGPQNRVIIADKRLKIIGILDVSGKFIGKFEVKKNGEPRTIDDIHATSQGNIIVVSNRYSELDIILLDPSGARLGEMTLKGIDKWFFSNGRMLADGRMYDFTKTNTKKIQPVVLENRVLEGREGYGDVIRGFAVDNEGNAYVGKEWNPVQVFDASGKIIDVVEGCSLPGNDCHMAVLANNHIAISDVRHTSIWDGEKFHKFTGDLLAVVGGKAVVGNIFGTYHKHHPFINSVYWTTLDFQKITMPDTVQALFRIHYVGPVSVATDAANRIIVGCPGCVKIMDPDCSVKKTITDADGQGGMFGAITAVTTDKKGRIVVADYCGERHEKTEHVRVFDASGKFLESCTGNEFRANGCARVADVLESYPKMACDSHDRVVVSTHEGLAEGYRRLRNQVEIRDASGNGVKRITVDGAHGERIYFADALTVDRWDRIIAVETYLLTIRIFDHAGTLTGTVRGTSIGGKSLVRIHGIASDGTGRIIISGRDENGVALIQIFGPGNKPRTKPGKNKQRTAKRDMDPLRILKVRYAKGEITDEQFEAMKKRLA